MRDDLRARNQDIVRAYLEAINRWDFDRMREVMHEDFVFSQAFAPPGMQKDYVGRESLIAFQQSLTGLIVTENLHDIELDTLGSDPGRVLATYRSDMELSEPGMSYANDYVSLFSVRDDRITGFTEYYDPVRLVLSFGGSVEPPVLT